MHEGCHWAILDIMVDKVNNTFQPIVGIIDDSLGSGVEDGDPLPPPPIPMKWELLKIFHFL